jgi:predicted transcriptional regulator
MIKMTLIKESLIKSKKIDKIKNPKGAGRKRITHAVKLDMAKEISMTAKDEIIKQTDIIYADKSKLDVLELELMGFIKNEHPKSVSELAKIANRDLSSVQKKIRQLKDNGFIDLKKGNKNSIIPIINYCGYSYTINL